MRRGIRARRVVRRFELWSVAKVAFLFHLCCGVVSLFAVIGLWFTADRVGTRDQIESFLGDLLGTKDFQLFGDKLLRAAIGVTGALILLATVGTIVMAFLYNMLSSIFGGVVVSVLQERVPLPRDVSANAVAAQAELARAPRRRRSGRRRAPRPAGPSPLVYEPPAVANPATTGPALTSWPVDESVRVKGPEPVADIEPEHGPSADEDWIAAAADPTGSWMTPGSR